METNGLHFQDLPLDWWTVSPKDAAGYRVQPRLWERASEFKLLVTPALDLARSGKYASAPGADRPAARTARPATLPPHLRLLQGLRAGGIPDVRLGLQLHRVYRIP